MDNTTTSDKIVVSRFEYAIMQAAKIPDIEKYRPITVDEEAQQRRENIESFLKSIKFKNG